MTRRTSRTRVRYRVKLLGKVNKSAKEALHPVKKVTKHCIPTCVDVKSRIGVKRQLLANRFRAWPR
jgi:hypothetical protein